MKKKLNQNIKKILVSKSFNGSRLDLYLKNTHTNLSRNRIKKLISTGQVFLDTLIIKDPNYRVKLGQEVLLNIPEASPDLPQPQNINLSVVFEDEDLIVIDKPAGMVVHPAPGNYNNTLVNALLAYCGDSLSGIGGIKRPGIVHRIDKDTSGLIVIAKNDYAHHSLSNQFRNHSIDRSYIAIVWGEPSLNQGKIENRIARHPINRKKMSIVDSDKGKLAITEYKLIKKFHPYASEILCTLRTGRTHQIRVHLSSNNLPIIGDKKYEKKSINRMMNNENLFKLYEIINRQALHAITLGFLHPKSNKKLFFESGLPSDINNLRNFLKDLQKI
ncbi:RluA family pseudouridine synthase [Alphaproteobacteria bacterium]|nr:RluA family pseudouridine synthase [Alphaproteobacteria bacterium]